MAITRYAGDRFTIAPTDTKPTGVMPGAFLIDSGNKTSFVKTGYTVDPWVQLAGGGGGGGSPGGSNTQVQFNNNGSFGGDADLTFTNGNQLNVNKLSIAGNVIDSNSSIGEGGMVLTNEGTTGVHWKNIESVLSGVGGSGVANYVARWSDEDTLTSGTIYDNGSVGISTATPGARLHIYSTAGGGDQLLIENSHSAAADAPDVVLYRNSPTPANSDDLGIIRFRGKNDGTDTGYGENKVIYADIEAEIISVVSGAEGGALNFHTQDNGTSAVRMVITGNNVGMGTVSPGCELHVYGEDPRIRVDGITDSHPGFELSENGTRKWITYNNYVNDNLTFKTNADIRMVIQQDGNVGIGTGGPDDLLHVFKSSGTSAIKVESNDSSASIKIDGVKTTDVGVGYLTFFNAGDSIANIATYRHGANDAGSLVFGTQPAGGGITERMRILSDGKVGIGTTAPSRLLTVENNTSTVVNQSQLRINNVGAGDAYVYMYAGADWSFGIDNSDADKFKFNTSNDVSDGTEVLTLQRDGNVGIGTDGPVHKFQVNGAAFISGTVLIPNGTNYFGAYNAAGNDYIKAIYVSTNDDVVVNDSNFQGNTIIRGDTLDVQPYDPLGVAQSTFVITGAGVGVPGSVGIGITTKLPQHTLHVSGDMQISGYLYDSTSSTGVDGYVLTSREDGPQWDYIEDILSGVGGNGTANYVPKWEDSDTIGNSIIYDDGDVGIGTDNPGYKLDVSGDGRLVSPIPLSLERPTYEPVHFGFTSDGSDHHMYLKATSAAATYQLTQLRFGVSTADTLIITDNGRVGIGTDTPFSIFHTDDSSGAIYHMTRTSGSTSGTLGVIRFGNTNIDSNLAGINGIQDGATDNAKITFTTQPTAGSTTERMVIKSDGKVGIGTTNPLQTLHVVASTGTRAARFDGVAQWYTTKVFGASTTNQSYGTVIQAGTTASDISFRILDAGGTVDYFAVRGDGNVGIGTAAPSAPLHISGSDNQLVKVVSTDAYAEICISDNTTTSTTSSAIGVTGDRLYLYSGGGQRLSVLGDGNVGIGTNAPGSLLQLKSDGTLMGGSMTVMDSGDNQARFYAGLDNNEHGYLSLVENDGTTGGLYLTGNSGTAAVNWILGKIGIGTATVANKLDIYHDSATTWAGRFENAASSNGLGVLIVAGNDANDFIFEARDKSSNTTKFGVMGDGNVGIGTTNPGVNLDVVPAAGSGNIRVKGQSASDASLVFNEVGVGDVGKIGWDGSDGLLKIAKDFSKNGLVVNTTSNKVGIGVALDPQHNLHVSGDAIISGVLYDSTNSSGVAGHVFTSEAGGPQWKMIEDVLSGVGGNGTAEYIPRWTDSDTIGDSVIAQSGSAIGIGTAAPGSLLQVNGSDTTAYAGNAAQDDEGVTLSVWNQDETVLGSYAALQLVQKGTGSYGKARIACVAPANNQGALAFTVENAGTFTEAMRILGDGKVGINMAIPGYKLDVYEQGSNEIARFAGANSGSITLRNDTANVFRIYAGASDSLGFAAGNSYNADHLTIASDGNVGIGTTNPLYRLHVKEGGIRIDNTGNTKALVAIATSTTESALQVEADSLTTGRVCNFYSNASGTQTREVVRIWNDNALSTGTTALKVIQDSTGPALVAMGNVGIGTNAPGSLLQLKSDGTLMGGSLTVMDSGDNQPRFYGGLDGNEHGYLSLVENDGTTGGLYLTGNSGATAVNWILGNVGVGETSPDMRLHVKNTINTAYTVGNSVTEAKNLFKLENASTTANAFAGMQFRIGSGCDLFFGAEQKTGNDGDFYFTNQGSPSTEIMRIKSTGKVGIGTDPDTPLHVYSGDNDVIKFQGGDHVRVLIDGTDSSEKSLNFSEAGSLMWKLGMENIAPFEAFVIKNNDNGAPQFVIDHSTGDVGIGTTTTSGYKLKVEGTTWLNDQAFIAGNNTAPPTSSNSQDFGAIRMSDGAFVSMYQGCTATYGWVQVSRSSNHATNYPLALNPNGGSVGIGTVSPSNKLDVASANETTFAADYKGLVITARLTGTDAYNSGTAGSGWLFSGKYNNAGNYTSLAGIGGLKENSTDGNYAGVLTFFTRANGQGAGASERMRILSSGYVGMGITNPGERLDVAGALRVQSTGPQIKLYDTDHDTHSILMDLSGGNFRFYKYTGSTGAGSSEVFRVTTAGVVRFNNAFSFPTADGTANQMLKTDGSGTLTWTSGGTGTVTGTGTDNFVPQWNGTTALEDSLIYSHAYGVIINATSTSSYATNRQVFEVFGTAGTGAFDGGIANLTAATNTNAQKVGQLVFVNSANANHVNPNAAAGSRIAQIISTVVTTDSNAGDDSGGDLQFWTKAEAGLPAERMRIQSDGNVGIGTTAPSAKLHVDVGASGGAIIEGDDWSRLQLAITGSTIGILNDDTIDAFSIYDWTASAYRLVVDTSGKVGIGTVSPNGTLDVAATGDATNPTIQIGYSTSSRANYRFGLYSDSEAGYLSNKNGNNGIRFVHRGGTVMQVGYGGDTSTPYVGIGEVAPTSLLQLKSGGNLMSGSITVVDSGGNQPRFYGGLDGNEHGYLSLVENNGTTGGLYLTGHSAGTNWILGKVGIGTASPGSKLQVTGGDISFGTRMDSATRYIGKGQSAGGSFGGNSNWIGFASDAADDWITFGVHESGVGGGEAMRINYDKKVGIGTTSPGACKLTVVGSGGFGSSSDGVIIDSESGYGIIQGTDNLGNSFNGLKLRTQGYAMIIPNAAAPHVEIVNKLGVGTPPSAAAILDVRDSGDANTLQILINTGQTTAGRETEFVFGKDNGANLSAALGYYYHTTQSYRRIDLYHYGTNAGLSVKNNGSIGFNDEAPDRMLTLKGGTINGATRYPGIHGHYGSNTLFVMEQWYGNEGFLGLYHNNVRTVQFRGGEQTAPSYIDNGNNFGLGTKTPGAKLEIQGATSARALLAVGSSTSAAVGYFYTNAIHTGVDTSSIVSIRSDHASSTGKVLHVRGDGSGNLLTLDQGGTDRLVVQADGKVGIGTTAPGALLHVNGDAIFEDNGSNINIKNTWSSGNHDINFVGGSSIGGSANNTAARIRCLATAPGGAATGDLTFTVNSGDSFVNALYIQEDGKVGIGTIVPRSLLEVGSAGVHIDDNYGIANFFGGMYYNGSSMVRTATGTRKAAGMYVNTGGHIQFITAPETSGTTATESIKFHIGNDGNVGIGEDAPSSLLQLKSGGNLMTGSITVVDSGGNQPRFYGGLDGNEHGYLSLVENDGTTGGLYLTGNSAGTNWILGKVGIGTNAPVGELELNGGATGPVELQFKDTSTAWHRLGLKKIGSRLSIGEYNNAGTTLTEILTVDGNGDKVGIGTTAPSQLLHVNGGADYNVRMTSASTRSGFVIDHPGTTSIMGSGLVLAADDSFRLGTASYYHMIMYQDGQTVLQGGGSDALNIAANQNATFRGSLTVEGTDTDIENLYVNQEAIFDGHAYPYADSAYTLGTNALRWSTIYGDAGNFSGAITGYSLAVTAENSGWNPGIALINTNADSSPAYMKLEKISASPADNDYIGGITFRGRNDAAEIHTYMEMWGVATDVSNGNESSKLNIHTWKYGVEYPTSLILVGNDVGMGVTPTAVNTSHRSLQIGGNANIQSFGTKGAGGEVDYCHNVYLNQDGNYKLISADEGTMYRQGGGRHSFYSWGSAAAGSNVSVTGPKFEISAAGAPSFIGTGSSIVMDVGSSTQTSYTDIRLNSNSGTGEIWKNGTGYTNYAGASGLNVYCSNGAVGIIPGGSSAYMTIFKADGKVGIGTTAPAAPLEIEANGSHLLFDTPSSSQNAWITWADNGTLKWEINKGTTNKFSIYSYTLADNVMTFLEDGKVGIGSVTPLDKFHVQGNILQLDGSPEYHFGTTSASHRNWRIACQEVVSQGFEIASGTASAGTGAPSDTYTNRFVIKGATGQIQFNSYGSGTHTGTSAKSLGVDSSGNVIEFTGGTGTVTGTGTDNYVPRWNGTTAIQDSVLFYAADNGNVGIGTNNPGTLLHLRRYDTTGPTITMSNNPKTGYINWWGAAGGGTDRTDQFEINAVADGYGATIGAKTYIRFKTDGLGATDERMRIASDGNVGIGTTNPTRSLDVNGTSYFRDDIYFGNTVLNPASGFSTQTGMGWDKSTGAFQIAASSTAALQVGRITTTGIIQSWRYAGTVVANVDSSGQITSVSGAVSAPSFSFTNDTNTGMSRPTTDSLNFVTAGAERVRIDANGNVGIGEQSPSSLLQLKSGGNLMTGSITVVDSGGNQPRFYGGLDGNEHGYLSLVENNGTTGGLYLTGHSAGTNWILGKVGIGTVTPELQFEIHTSSGNAGQQIVSADGQSASILLGETISSGHINRGFRIKHDGNTNLFQIARRDNSTSDTNVLTIKRTDGNVGIGTTAPGAYKLRVQGDVYISGTLTEASSLGIKENIETYSPSLEKINKIRPVRYNKKKSKKKEVGLVADELAEMFPELVEMDRDGKPAGVNYSRAVAVLLHGFKELYKEVKELKEKI